MGRAVLGLAVLTVVLASWCVVAVSLVLLYRAGLAHGMGDLGAAALATPATFVPAWRSWAMLRAGPGLVEALISHLWVLNGSVGYLILILAALGVGDTVRLHVDGGRFTWPLALAAATGFLVVLGGMVALNVWMFRRATHHLGNARPDAPPPPGERP